MRPRQLLELTRPIIRDNADDLLRENGWQQIGQDTNATVFARQDRPFVLKLFEADDYAYLRYLRLVMTETSPHYAKSQSRSPRMEVRRPIGKARPLDGNNRELAAHARSYTRKFIEYHRDETERYAMAKHSERLA